MLDDAAGLDEIDPSIDEDEEGQEDADAGQEDADAEPLLTQEEGHVGRQYAALCQEVAWPCDLEVSRL